MGTTTTLVDRDRGWTAMLDAAQELARGAHAKVGILGNTDRGGLHQVDPATGKAADLTVAEIGVVNEFGTADKRIPARPFVRPTFDRLREELTQDAGKLLVKVVLDRTMTAEQALNILGLKLASAIRSYIVDGSGVPPPNAPSTLARKLARGEWNAGHAKMGPRTLVDTGRMLSAIAWAVVVDGAEKDAHYVTGR